MDQVKESRAFKLDAFAASTILAALFMKTKEETLDDIIAMRHPEQAPRGGISGAPEIIPRGSEHSGLSTGVLVLGTEDVEIPLQGPKRSPFRHREIILKHLQEAANRIEDQCTEPMENEEAEAVDDIIKALDKLIESVLDLMGDPNAPREEEP
jgi:hypothetical protein